MATRAVTTKEAMCQIANELHNDAGYRIGWQANIAMAFYDQALWYKSTSGKKYLTNVDLHRIANGAANNFIDQLVKDEISM